VTGQGSTNLVFTILGFHAIIVKTHLIEKRRQICGKHSISPNSTKTTIKYEKHELEKIGFPCHTLTVHLRSGLYVHHVTTGRTSSKYHMSVMWVLRENFIFSPLSAYSSTPRASGNTLKPLSVVYNLHAT
jgi:hypothetical protein